MTNGVLGQRRSTNLSALCRARHSSVKYFSSDARGALAAPRASRCPSRRSAPPRSAAGTRRPAARTRGAVRRRGGRIAGRTRAVARRAAGRARAGAAGRRRGGARHCARRIVDVLLRLFGAARHRFTRLAVHVLAALDPFAGGFLALLGPLTRVLRDLAIAFLRLVRERARLFGELVAQLGAGPLGEQHAEAHTQHGAGQQPHHETATAAAFVVAETIVYVCHVASSRFTFCAPDAASAASIRLRRAGRGRTQPPRWSWPARSSACDRPCRRSDPSWCGSRGRRARSLPSLSPSPSSRRRGSR